MFIGKSVYEFLERRGGGIKWAVGTEDGFLEAGNKRGEEHGNLAVEGEVSGGKAASATNEFSD